MSNNPSSPVVARIQPSTLIFAVLVLILGALLLASTGIDPRASVRASLSATPVPPTITFTPAPTSNPYASTGYKTFQSADNVLKVDYPGQWTASADTQQPFTYVFSPAGTPGSSGALVVIQLGNNSDLATGLSGATANSTPREILTLAFGQPQAGQPQVVINDVKAGSVSGAGVHQVNPTQNGQPTNQERELWILTLPAGKVALIQATSAPGDWAGKMAPIFQHMMDSMVINTAAIPTPTIVGTAAATGAATIAPTQAVTQAVTTAPTIAATKAATLAPTLVQTLSATTAPTMAATSDSSGLIPTMVPPLPTATNATK